MTSHAKYCLFTRVAKVTSHGRLFRPVEIQSMLDNRGYGQLLITIYGTLLVLCHPWLSFR